MKHSLEKYRVVFLIDCRLSVTDKDAFSDKIAIVIRQVALKLLTYFSSRKLSDVEWGFKFFNSCSLEGFARKTELKQLSVESFEEFEDAVDTVLDGERFRGTGLAKSPSKKVNSDDFVLNNQVNHAEFDTLQTLRQALTELIYDFQWTSPDVSSPVSARKRPGLAKLQKAKSSKKHFTFLIMKLPHQESSFKDFFEIYKDKYSGANLFEALFTKLLYEKFFNDNGIRLFWLDVSERFVVANSTPCTKDNCKNEEDFSCMAAMTEALQNLQGAVVPVNALLQLQRSNQHLLTQLLSSSTNQSTGDNNLLSVLPASSILNFYLQNCAQLTIEGLLIRNGRLLDCGGKELAFLSVKSLINGERSSSSSPPDGSSSQDLKLNVRSSNSRERETSCCYAVCHEISSGHAKDPTFKMLATMAYSDVPYECLLSSHVYMCYEDDKRSPAGEQSYFTALLQRLAKRKLILVLDFTEGNSSVMCLLQPLTPVCGSLSCIKSGSAYLLEKSLYLPQSVTESTANSLQEFVEKSISHIVGDLPVNSGSHVIPCRPVNNKLCDTVRTVEAWTLSAELTTVSARASGEQDSDLIDKLQVAYKKEPLLPVQVNKDSSDQSEGSKVNASALKDSTTKDPVHEKLSRTFRNSRSRAMIERSKTRLQKKTSNSPVKSEIIVDRKENKNTRAVATVDFSDEYGLLAYITDSYSSAIDRCSDPLLQAQSIISLVLHFSRTKCPSGPEDYCRSLLSRSIQQTSSYLRKKYSGLTSEDDLRRKEKEYELQVLLHMELVSIAMPGEKSHNEEELAEEIARLVTAAFIGSPEALRHFMEEILVDNYIDTSPSLLREIYLELGQDPPCRLAPGGIFSPQSQQLPSVQQPGSIGSSYSSRGSASSNPGSNRPRRLARHSSVLEAVSQRQIVMPLFRPVKVESKANDGKVKEKQLKAAADNKDKRITRSATKKKKEIDPKLEVKKVRRNLFMGEKLEKRQSDSAIQLASLKRHGRRSTSDARVKTLKTKSVAETPAHKQVSNVALRKLEKHQRSHTASEMLSVGESPRKPGEKESPRVPLIKQRSFYSAALQGLSRNMEKYQKLAERFSRPFASPTKIIADTPKRRAAVKSVFFSQLLSSPHTNETGQSSMSSPSAHVDEAPRPEMDGATTAENLKSGAKSLAATPKRKGQHVKKLLMDSPVCNKVEKIKVQLKTPEKAQQTETSDGHVSRQSTPRSCNSRYKLPVVETPPKNSPIFGARFSGKKLQKHFDAVSTEAACCEQKLSSPLHNRKLSTTNDSCPSCSKSAVVEYTVRQGNEKENKIQTRMCSFTPKSTGESEEEHDFTPPISKKPKLSKTPDSFDSWHRRKHQSPRVRKNSSHTTPVKAIPTRQASVDDELIISFPTLEKQGFDLHDPKSAEKLDRKIAREKRGEQTVNFPFYEKQGYDLRNSESAEKLRKRILSGEQTSSSANSSSARKSLSNSYFSSENEDVFLSGEDQPWEPILQSNPKPTVLRLKRRSTNDTDKPSANSCSQDSNGGCVTRTFSTIQSSEKRKKFSPLSTGSLHQLLKSPMVLDSSSEKLPRSRTKMADRNSKSRRSLYQ